MSTKSPLTKLPLISRATFASSSRSPLSFSRSIRPISSTTQPRNRFLSQRIFLRPASTLTSTSPHLSPSLRLPILPGKSNIKVIPPDIDAIKSEGFLDNPELIPIEEAWMNITPEAVSQLASITSREPPDVLSKGLLALRVGVESGGCHGYQYTMALTEERGVDDYVMQPQGINSIPVVVDLTSLGLLKGATLHHATELIGSSFRLVDNPQAKDGGACGCGVSWEAK